MLTVENWVFPFLTAILSLMYGIFLKTPKLPRPAESLNSTYDYIVVGGGAAGSVIANRLSEDDVSVLLLEAGEEETDKPIYDIPFNAAAAIGTSADWQYYTVPQQFSQKGMIEQKSFWPRGRGLGGTTLLNGLAYMRSSRYDYDTWAADGCTGWGYDDILPYFLKSEDMRTAKGIDKKFHSSGGPLAVSDATVSVIADEFYKAAESLGYRIQDCNGNGGDHEGFCRMQATIGDGKRWNAAWAFLLPVMRRKNLHVSVQSHVTKILIENKKASGVTFVREGLKTTVRANKEVILSAGSIGTPQILMLSGVGPKSHLQELKIPVVADLPVGNNLNDHMMMYVPASLDKPVSLSLDRVNTSWNRFLYHTFKTGILTNNAGVEATGFVRVGKKKPSDRAPDIQFILVSSLAEQSDEYNHFNRKTEVIEGFKEGMAPEGFSIATLLLHPRSKGTIRLKSDDPFDYPLIDPHYLEDPEDVQTFIKGIRTARRLIQTDSMKAFGAKPLDIKLAACSDMEYDTDGYWECMLRHLAVTVYHPTSTCRMGPKSDPNTVVDPELRVKGIQNLRVADASIMPFVTSANTMAPTYMIAEKAADMIRGKYTVAKFQVDR